ncbi:MAG: 50S ribosome-binding GTPase [Verrucomicrobia bacterium]|nr:50S ribosome-binding GTPase [Verrucomicrobiota bacterium]MCH8512506.1 50S ribosome-binding GTPase [Kiritimatiellia bacterium]
MKFQTRHWRMEALGTLLWLLPFLIPYGYGLWALYVHDLLWWWMLAMLGISLLIVVFSKCLQRRDHGIEVLEAAPQAAEAEQRARAALREMMNAVGPEDVASAKAVETLIREVLRVVAEAWNPGRRQAELQFTVPEALALAEHLSHRLRIAVKEDLPALQHIKISHAVSLQKHTRPVRALWNVYRLGRFALNPVGSVVAELRRGVMQSITPALMESMRTKAAALLVRETGEAAMLLYSGHMRHTPLEKKAEQFHSAEDLSDQPLVIFVTGQPNVGKSSLINALSGRDQAVVSPITAEEGDDEDFVAYGLEEETAGDLILLEGPGLKSDPDKRWLQQAQKADLILWVMAAHRADRARDQRALAVLKAHFQTHVRKRPPPIVWVLTHVDRLEPAREWEPPYDMDAGQRHKEESMRASHAAAMEAMGVSEDRIVPVMCEKVEGAWNLPTLWKKIHESLPGARQVRLGRVLAKRSRLAGATDAMRTLPGILRAFKKYRG